MARLTQKEIAKRAGVSQATVSLIVNASPLALERIPAETRERVERVIEDTGYVADPVARRMVKGENRILGVFTYEPAFPSGQADFYAPLLRGIEEAAEALGYDLLLLTAAARSPDGRKHLLDKNNRLRLADGCLLLGSQFDRDELAHLLKQDYPFVSVGRRDDAGGLVRYVGADYVSATRKLVRQAAALSHRKFGYVYAKGPAEALADRWRGFIEGLPGDAEIVYVNEKKPINVAETFDAVMASGATVVLFGELLDAVRFEELAVLRGVSVPDQLSIIVLGNDGGVERPGRKFLSFNVPRTDMARIATEMLVGLLQNRDEKGQIMLTCASIAGDTLGPAPAGGETA